MPTSQINQTSFVVDIKTYTIVRRTIIDSSSISKISIDNLLTVLIKYRSILMIRIDLSMIFALVDHHIIALWTKTFVTNILTV